MFIDFPLPSAESVFADVTNAPGIDRAELDRVPVLADSAADALDLDALDALAERVGEIARRNVANLGVLRLVKRAQSHVRLARARAARELRGMGL